MENTFGLSNNEIDYFVGVVSVNEKEKSLILQLKSGKKIQRSGGTVSWRCNNPGNLKYGDFAKQHGAVGAGPGDHAVFPTYIDGGFAHYNLLFRNDSRYIMRSIADAMAIYAPVNDPNAKNDPVAYSNFLARKLGVHPSTKLVELSDVQRWSILIAMQAYEGYKIGTTKVV
jgi:hypothetical protein